MARIRIYLARHLCTAPRPQKEADALAAAGHEVSVHGMAYRADYSARDTAIARNRAWRWEPVVDFTRSGKRPAWLLARVRHRLARDWFATTGLVAGDVWGYAHGAIAAHARQNPADLTLVHAEGGLAFAAELLHRGHRVGVDFEDWFSRDLTPGQQRGRPVAKLAELEAMLLHHTPYATTTSRSLAEAMAAELQCPAPAVIYNTFPRGPEPQITVDPNRPVSLFWFSLVLGPERGLEALFSALPAVQVPWTLHLRGDGDPAYRETLLHLLPDGLRSRVSFAPTVPAALLPELLARHDIGLAVEISTIPNKNLTLSNKFFHYLQAGLAVVASDTAGHREGLERAPGAGRLFPPGDCAALAAAINRLAGNPAELLAARQAARQAFVSRLAQEHQSARYAELASAALAR